MSGVKWDMFTCKNTKSAKKPNEDLALYNEKAHIGMLLDGVSRDKENGMYPVPSPSAVATKLFSDEVQKLGDHHKEIGLGVMEEIVFGANQKLNEYNEQLQHRFPAGTVGIVFSIYGDLFHYAYIGDCYAAVIRGDARRIFTECQTCNVMKHKKEYTSDEIRFDICNHVSHPCGYGVWDGNPGAMDFVKYGTIKINEGDVIFLYSDGLEKEVAALSNSELARKPVNVLFTDHPANGNDDRTCLRITIV